MTASLTPSRAPTASPAPRRAPASRSLGLPLATALGALVCTTVASGQISVRRVLDLEDTPESRSSDPEFGAELPGGVCIFAATDHTHGREVWRTVPGSAPVLLKDIFPGATGSHPRAFALFQGEVWFSASDGQNGRELWKTDGTTAGTVLVTDLFVGPGGSAPSGLAVQGSTLYFSAFDAQGGREPHVSDGTAAGTQLLKDVRPGASGSDASATDPHVFHPSDVGDTVFFAADDGVSGVELWKTDGTAAGTVLVADLQPGPDAGFDTFERPVVLNGTLFFRGDDGGDSGSELYKSNGTVAGTVRVRDLRAGVGDGFPSSFVVHQRKVYFSAVDTNLGRELFETDGTFVGTRIVKDLRPGSASSSPDNLTSCGNLLYFSANDAQAFLEPHVSDGTEQGTQMLADVVPGLAGSLPENFTCCGNLVFFRGFTANQGRELYVTDGRIGNVTQLGDLQPGSDSSSPESLFCCGGGTLVGSADSPQGREFLQSDGTVSGTRIVDLDPSQTTASSNPRQIRGVDHETYYFIATTALHGSEVFFFDGTRARPIEVRIGRDGSGPSGLTTVGRSAYWTASDGVTGTELYRSIDGGPAERVADLRPGSTSSSPRNLTAFDHETLIATARTPNQGTEIIVARNGQPGVQIFDLRAGAGSSSPSDLNLLIDAETGANFVVFTARGDGVGNELFAFNGVNVQVAVDFEPGTSSGSPRKLTPNRDHTALLLEARINGSNRLIRLTADENAGGLILDFPFEELLNLGRSFILDSVADQQEALRTFAFRALLLLNDFAAGQTGLEPYGVDGNGNVSPLMDIHPGPEGSDPESLGLSDTAWTIQADNGEERETYRFDRTTGAMMRFDNLPGKESSNPSDGVQFGDSTLFTASVSVDAERSVVAIDERGAATHVPVGPSGLRELTNLGSKVIGVAEDQQAGGGRELVEVRVTNARATEFGVPCDGRARTWATTPRIDQEVIWKTVGGQPGDLGFQLIGPPARPTGRFSGCDVYIDARFLLTVFAGLGPKLENRFRIPNDPALIDAESVLQGGWISTTGGSPVLTNGVFQVIGD